MDNYLAPQNDETTRLTVDVVLFSYLENLPHCRHVLLIERSGPPFQGYWALPGGVVEVNEDVEVAARRELTEETGLQADRLDFINVYSMPHRDPRGRYVSWAFTGFLPGCPAPVAASDARKACWRPLNAVRLSSLAFDHNIILHDACLLIKDDESETALGDVQ